MPITNRACCLGKARFAITLAYDWRREGNHVAALKLLSIARRYIERAQVARPEAA